MRQNRTNPFPITITSYQHTTSAAGPDELEQALVRIQQAAEAARHIGHDDLAEDLDGGALLLQAAVKAQREGKAERRAAKLEAAHEVIERAAANDPALRALAETLRQIGRIA